MVVLCFLGSKWAILEVKVRFKTVFGSTHALEQLLFFMLPLVLTFDFDLMIESFSTFQALMGYFLCRCRVQKLFWSLLI